MMTERPEAPDQTPRFALGELVMVRSRIDPARNTDCTRVIDREWFEGEAQWGWYRGWQYVVADHVDAWAFEKSLKPRPQPGTESWDTLLLRLSHDSARESACESVRVTTGDVETVD